MAGLFQPENGRRAGGHKESIVEDVRVENKKEETIKWHC